MCVGGSVAGAAAACFLAGKGLRVLVLDRAVFPRHKACGEGVLPQGVDVLRRLGVPLGIGAPTQGIRFTVGGRTSFFEFPGVELTGEKALPDPPPGYGLAVSRFMLDEAIRVRAREAGAEFLQARARHVIPAAEEGGLSRVVTDRGTFVARFLVGADGTHSIFHRDLGIETRDGGDRVGLSVHLDGFESRPGWVDVASLPGGETYVAPLGGGETLVALLVRRDLGLGAADVVPYLRNSLGGRMSGAHVTREVLGAAPLARRVSRCAGRGWLLVGDAAGAVDPVSGEGLSLALAEAEIAGEIIPRILRGKASSRDYEVRSRTLRRPAERFTRFLLMLSAHPRLARWVLRNEIGPPALMEVAVGRIGFGQGLARSFRQAAHSGSGAKPA